MYQILLKTSNRTLTTNILKSNNNDNNHPSLQLHSQKYHHIKVAHCNLLFIIVPLWTVACAEKINGNSMWPNVGSHIF